MNVTISILKGEKSDMLEAERVTGSEKKKVLAEAKEQKII